MFSFEYVEALEPKIKTGRLSGSIIADARIEFLPKERAPAKAPKKEIIRVPKNKEPIKLKSLSTGKYSRNTIEQDSKINGRAVKIQLTKILTKTTFNIENPLT